MARGIDITKLFGRTPAITETAVITVWKGLTVLRKKPTTIISMSAAQIQIRNALKAFSKDWFGLLTDTERSSWNLYAKSKEDLAHWNYIMSSTIGVIPKKKNIMSGFNAFISSNMLADSVNFPHPRKTAPTIEKLSSPLIISISYPDPPDVCNITWSDPITPTGATNKKVRVWAEVLGKAHKQIVSIKNFGVNSLTFTTMKSINGITKTLHNLEPGTLRIQMDTIAAKPNEGPEHSFFSNLMQITI